MAPNHGERATFPSQCIQSAFNRSDSLWAMARDAGEGSSTVICFRRLVIFVSFLFVSLGGAASPAPAEQRIALVIGQGAYESGALPTAVNDAGLVAQTLTSAGFEVVQGRDLGSNDLRLIVRDFLDKVQAAEDDAAVVVYLAGHGVQFEGENYLVPVDARITRDVDVPLEGFRLSDIVRSLSAAPGRVRIVVADMNRQFPLASTGQPIAQGLALVEPPEGFLIAFSSSPNIPALDEPGPYGAYATALVERIREPGLAADEIFAQVRLRTHEETKGLQTPWHASNLGTTDFVFFELAETATVVERRPRPRRAIEALPAEEAYALAIERDTIQDYQAFLRRHPDHRLARRVTGLLAARREAVVWQKTVVRDSREAYWTYVRRYPRGPHIADARRRLVRLAAPFEPPLVFEEVIYEDLPPPLPIIERVEIVEVVTIIREAPPPPPPPIYLLPARDYDDDLIVTVVSVAPPPPPMIGILPIPVPIPVPVRARPPVAFYQPIAPITPRGPVAIPVAPPPVQLAPAGVAGGRPPRVARPVAPVPTIPDQPGLAAPVQPLPVAAAPTAPVAPTAPGARPRTPAPAPRIPLRPIPLPGTTPGEPPRPAASAAQPAAPSPGQAAEPTQTMPGAPGTPSGRPAAGQPAAAPPGARQTGPGAAAPGTASQFPGAGPSAPGATPPAATSPTGSPQRGGPAGGPTPIRPASPDGASPAGVPVPAGPGAGRPARPGAPATDPVSPGGPPDAASRRPGSRTPPTSAPAVDEPSQAPTRPIGPAPDRRPAGEGPRRPATPPDTPSAAPPRELPSPALRGTDPRAGGRGGQDRTRPADEPPILPGARTGRPVDAEEAPRRGGSAPTPGPRAVEPPFEAPQPRRLDAPAERPLRPTPEAAPDLGRPAPGRPRAAPPAERLERRNLQPEIQRAPDRPPALRPPFERPPVDRPSLERPRPEPRFERPPLERPMAPAERSRPEPQLERSPVERGPSIERMRTPPQFDRAPVERPPVERPSAAPERPRPPPQFDRPTGGPPPAMLQQRPEGPPPGAGPQQRRGRPQGCPPGEACAPGRF
jgi:uncharacterized caspase-like protein